MGEYMKRATFISFFLILSLQLAGDFNRGVSLYKQKQYWDAKEEFRKTLTAEKGHLPANAMLASCLYRLRKYDAILSYFPILIRDRTINLNDLVQKKYSCLLLKQIGFACLQTGQSKKAVVALSIANKLISNDPTIYNSLGLAYLKIGKFRLAEISFQTAVNLFPLNHFYHNNLGAAYLELGEYKMALRCFEKSVRMEWNYANGWDNVWVSRAKLGMASHRGWKSYSYFMTATDSEKERDRWRQAKEQKERLHKEQLRREKEQARKRNEQRQKDEERRKKAEARRKADQRKQDSAKTNRSTNKKPPPKSAVTPSPKPSAVKTEPSGSTNS